MLVKKAMLNGGKDGQIGSTWKSNDLDGSGHL
jgi:hypothetical protein